LTENTQPAPTVPRSDASDESNVTLADLEHFRVRLVDGLSLEELAEEANRTISALDFLERMTLPRAVYAGQVLNAAKKRAGYGQWLKWFDTHIWGCSLRKAEVYMALANGEAEGKLDLKNAESANFTIYGAHERLKQQKKSSLKPLGNASKIREDVELDEAERELQVLRRAYEEAPKKARRRFHKWMLDQYGLAVAPGTGTDAICHAYDQANKDERKNFSEWLRDGHKLVVVPLGVWKELKSMEEELERLDNQS